MWLSFVRSSNCSSLYLMNSLHVFLVLFCWVVFFLKFLDLLSVLQNVCRKGEMCFFSGYFSVLVVASNLLASGLR